MDLNVHCICIVYTHILHIAHCTYFLCALNVIVLEEEADQRLATKFCVRRTSAGIIQTTELQAKGRTSVTSFWHGKRSETRRGEIPATFSSAASKTVNPGCSSKTKVTKSNALCREDTFCPPPSAPPFVTVQANLKNDSIRRQENEQLVLTLYGMLD